MRLKHLSLKAVGPFTDRTLDFNSKEPGLHIIYGPNEAGKSSSLRALKALLYGFPQQTPDNFLHNYEQLLVGGCLVNSNGEELLFWRRKKRIGDIIDEAGNPLPANVLQQFLHGLEPEIFGSLYGIDHDTLIRGGEEILAQKGEIGQALFAAGAGISSLREVTNRLEKEAADLFKPTGQLPQINQAIKKFKELQKETKAASLSCKEWKDHQKALQVAETERIGLEKERDRKNKELHRLERLAQAIPELGSLQSYREQLQALGNVPPLPPNFTEDHRLVLQAIREADLQLQKDTENLKKLAEKRRALSFNKDLLNQAAKLDDLHQRLGEYRKGQKDRPEREGMRISLRREAAHLLQQVRPDLTLKELEPLRSMLVRKKSIQRLSAEQAAISQQLLLAKKQHKAADLEYQKAVQDLAALPAIQNMHDSQKLSLAVKMALKEGNIDALLEKNKDEIEQDKNDWFAELKRLGRWSGELTGLIELPLPLTETVQQYEKKYSDIADEKRTLEKEQHTIEQELKKTLDEIKKGSYITEIPSEETLLRIRDKRDQGWQLLRRQWLDHEDVRDESRVYAPHQPLPEAYEGYVRQGDDVADRLRREADRVANGAALQVQAERLRESLAEIAKRKTLFERREEKLTANWLDLWHPAGIPPLSPKEMQGWLAAMDKLRYKAGEILKKEQEMGRTIQRRQNIRKAVQLELQAISEQDIPSGEAVGPLLVFAETILENRASRQAESQRLTERKAAAQKSLSQANEELLAARESLAQWQDQWNMAIADLGLTSEITTSEVMDLLDILQTCFDRVKEADDLQKRIDGINRDARTFENDVQTLLTGVAPDYLTLPPDQAILQVRTLLSQSQKERTLYDKLREEIDALQTEVAGAEKTLLAAKTQMDELLRQARSDTQEELATAISKFDEYTKLTEKISDTQANLARIGAGAPIEEIIKQAARLSADELPGQIEALRQDIAARIHPEINRVSQTIGEQTSKLAAMDGNARAAELAEKMEEELAGIRRLAERYTLVKLASKILQQEIERYREEHQDPVLVIASRYFHQMTLGSFAGLRTDVDDKGAPVLIGMRQGDIRVPVEGMSSGTRDQLYLALRLATLEYRLESHEPMPFIVDDILINFDDQRSRATLQALARLAARNQVILFTHHRQIVDEAKNITDNDAVVVHSL
jgi:uncharacterized protein YhaN